MVGIEGERTMPRRSDLLIYRGRYGRKIRLFM